MKRIIHNTTITKGEYVAHMIVRQNVKGAKRECHEFASDRMGDLWYEAIEFLAEGFSVISVDIYEVA
jgi:hypothetical protein